MTPYWNVDWEKKEFGLIGKNNTGYDVLKCEKRAVTTGKGSNSANNPIYFSCVGCMAGVEESYFNNRWPVARRIYKNRSTPMPRSIIGNTFGGVRISIEIKSLLAPYCSCG